MADDKVLTTDAADMKELRQEFDDATAQWRDIREERQKDMRYVAGDPWDPKARKVREEANRPIITADELGQYVNQIVNDVRQNKRAIRVTPIAAGATPQTADYRQNRIRQIEYKSNAQQGAYTSMFENTVQGSYGFLRVKADYENHRSFNQELRIVPIPNPDLVTPDPYGVMPDGSDWKYLWLAESWSKKDFNRKWPRAKFQDFSKEQILDAGSWIKGERMTIAERWCIKTKPRRLLLFTTPDGGAHTFFEDEKDALAKLPPDARYVKDRQVDYPYVYQEITNGLEILERNDWPGTSIPFVSCYGKVLYVDMGKGPERKILSAVRLARDPYMLYCYYRTQQAEMAAMIPKAPVVGYKGQFAGNEDAWQKAPHEPIAYLEANWTVEGMPPGTVLPLPQRIAYEAGAHLSSLELCAEGARRAIQAAMGISPLPTEMQAKNQKSGRAMDKIESSQQKGSFHFVDHFDASITRTGAILDELLPHYDETMRDVTVRKGDDEAIQVRINDPNDAEAIDVSKGQHDVTISVGPAFQSEREAASAFADTLIGSPLLQLLEPPKAQRILALAIRLKSVGPLGDEMADVISPKDQDGKPSMQDVQALQQQVQDLSAKLQMAVQEIQNDTAKQRAQIEIAKIAVAKELAIQRMKDATEIRKAEITATKETVHAAVEDETEAIALHMEQAHDAIQAELDRNHERAMGAAQAAHGAAQAEQGHRQALEQADAGVAGQMAVNEQSAALQPPAGAE